MNFTNPHQIYDYIADENILNMFGKILNYLENRVSLDKQTNPV